MKLIHAINTWNLEMEMKKKYNRIGRNCREKSAKMTRSSCANCNRINICLTDPGRRGLHRHKGKTSGPIGAWKCNCLPYLENKNIRTTNRPTNGQT